MGMNILIHILITALSLLIVAKFIPGVAVDSLTAALIVALVLGLLNFFIRPVLIVLTLPITLLTLGLFIFIINAALFMFAASFIDGFHVDGFVSALLGSVVVSVLSTIGNKLVT